jgi:valyl-tRNA synthetase
MFGCHFQPPTPFEVVAIHGMVRDAQGKKMSKSFGNVIDPIELMDRYGTDALRFALIRGANPGGDVPLAEEWVEGARNFANKLWNLGRFILSIEGAESAPTNRGTPSGFPGPLRPNPPQPSPSSALADRWLLSRLEATRAAVTAAYERFDPAEAARLLHGFAWSELADWAVELAKPRLAAGGEDADRAAATLTYALDVTLRLLHPVMPFVTETLWKTLTGGESAVVAAWPQPSGFAPDPVAAQRITDMQKLITEVRRFRSDQGLADRQKVPARLSDIAAAQLSEQLPAITSLAWLTEAGDGFTPSAAVEVRLSQTTVVVEVDTSGTVDVAAERRRLEKDLAVAQKEMATTAAKLGNDAFLAKAPAEVVDKIRGRQQVATEEVERITARLAGLK